MPNKYSNYLLLAFGVLILGSIIANTKSISSVEASIFWLINNLPDSFRNIFLVITAAGSQWMLFGVTLILIGLGKGRLALRTFSAGIAAYLTTEILKQVIGRARPGQILENVNVRELLVMGNGFPSGHTAVATAMAGVIYFALPTQLRWISFVWIGLVGVSRIYLGVHAPLDIVGGIAVGAIVVISANMIRGKLMAVRKITGMKLQ